MGSRPANTNKLNAALSRFPDAKLQTKSQFTHNQLQGLTTLLNLLYVLLSLSIIVSLFGIVNTLVLVVFERTRELGMLRAVGMTRRQVRRMIRHESIITALLGAAFGIPLGVVLALLVGEAIKYPAFTIPVGTLIVFVIAAVIAGDHRGDLAGAAGRKAERARGAAVRVDAGRGGSRGACVGAGRASAGLVRDQHQRVAERRGPRPRAEARRAAEALAGGAAASASRCR